MGKILHTSQHTYIYSHIHYNKITMARNPYELRMECLQMAEARLQQRFDETKQRYEFLDEKRIIQDPNDYPKVIEEIRENNKVIRKQIGVTTPGVKLTSPQQTYLLQDSDQSLSSWRVEITNTALISTNASLSSNGVIRQADNQEQSWYVGISNTSFTKISWMDS